MNRNTGSRSRLLGAALTVIMIVGTFAAAQAQGPGRGRGGHDRPGREGRGTGQGFERMAERLELTAEQQEAIAKVHEETQAANLELRKKVMRLRNEMRGEMLKDEPSEKTVIGLTQKIGELRTDLRTNRLQTRLAMRKLLTAEQRDKMLMFENHSGWRERGCDRGPQGGGCPRGPGHGGRGNGRRAAGDQ